MTKVEEEIMEFFHKNPEEAEFYVGEKRLGFCHDCNGLVYINIKEFPESEWEEASEVWFCKDCGAEIA